MKGGAAGRCRLNTVEPEAAEIEGINKGVYRANRIVLIDPIVEALGQKRRLTSICAFHEPLHDHPPQNHQGNHNHAGLFTQPGSGVRVPTAPSSRQKSLKKQTESRQRSERGKRGNELVRPDHNLMPSRAITPTAHRFSSSSYCTSRRLYVAQRKRGGLGGKSYSVSVAPPHMS
jgi:hypothetical protein